MKPFSRPFEFFIKRLPAAWLLHGITAACGSGFLLFGFDQGILGGVLSDASFERQFPSLVTNSTLQGATVAIYEIGCAVGSIGIFFGEKLGRRRALIYGMIVLCMGAILQFLSYELAQLIVGRIVTGIGNGMTSSTMPVWHSETSTSHDRGRNVCIELSVNIFGVMLAYWVDYGFRNYTTDWQWRFPLSLQVAFCVITITLACFMPESPRWLASQGRIAEARKVIFVLERSSGEKREKATEVELKLILDAIEEERSAGTSSLKDCFVNGEQRFLHRVLLGCGGQMMQQLSAINLITYYAPVIFQESVGLPPDISSLLSGFLGLFFFVSSIIPIPLIDRLGRRKLMLFGASGMCACMAVLAAMTADTGNHTKGIIATACLFLFDFFFSIGWLGIPWLYAAEMVPLQVRSKSAALSTMTNWLITFLVVMITPVSIGSIGYKTYIIFACFNLAFIPITYFFYVETTGQTLEDVDQLFKGSAGVLLGPTSSRRAWDIRRQREVAEGDALSSNNPDAILDEAHSKSSREYKEGI